jgi:hypothetical protein
MPVSRGHRVLLLSTAFAIAAGTAGVALGDDEGERASSSSSRDFPPLRDGQWAWSFSSYDGDVVDVRSRRCPKHHPHRVGSFSYHTTKVVNGKVESHSSTGSFCAK